ncbi:MAG: hypothetical protein HYU99_09600 [Deltaproteobacteria bacterium]|nr:hypothetical protein [Deltaproteobacteria bacterium]
MDRVVTFDGCDLEYSPRDAVLNGGFTNTIENGGDGLCEASDTIDFAHMVMGRDGLDAVHTHQIDEDAGMVFTWGNSIGDHTVTVNGLHTETFSGAVDGDNDGAAESVTVTLEKSISRVHEIDGEVENEVTVFTSDDDFEAEDSDGNPITVEVSLPVHEVTIDEDTGLPEGRTIVSGNLIVDNESDSLRMIFSVDDEGLSFDDGSTCGPVDGTITIVGYTIEDDGTIGAEVGTGEVVFEDGEVQSATFDGITLEPQPRPCS